MDVRKLRSLLSETFSAWNAHEAPRLGAALAFYTMLSLAPLLILVVAIVGLAFGTKAAESQTKGSAAFVFLTGSSGRGPHRPASPSDRRTRRR